MLFAIHKRPVEHEAFDTRFRSPDQDALIHPSHTNAPTIYVLPIEEGQHHEHTLGGAQAAAGGLHQCMRRQLLFGLHIRDARELEGRRPTGKVARSICELLQLVCILVSTYSGNNPHELLAVKQGIRFGFVAHLDSLAVGRGACHSRRPEGCPQAAPRGQSSAAVGCRWQGLQGPAHKASHDGREVRLQELRRFPLFEEDHCRQLLDAISRCQAPRLNTVGVDACPVDVRWEQRQQLLIERLEEAAVGAGGRRESHKHVLVFLGEAIQLL
mmetsp:Transcript_15049/g.38692  ORF Transcript_15049/g.38692 Transcript_15049/m.38692 type:complete len:270 (+) Transcript_15049:425-1234(+)